MITVAISAGGRITIPKAIRDLVVLIVANVSSQGMFGAEMSWGQSFLFHKG